MAKKTSRTYILDLIGGGRRKITIPATWKITFGNVLPYNKTNVNPYDAPEGWKSRIVLRIYEGNKDNLRAVMHDVLSLREDTVIVSEGRQKKVTTAKLKMVDGKQDVEFREVNVGEWFDPDTEYVQKQKGEKDESKRADR